MAFPEFQSLLALHCLKAPLDPNPTTHLDKLENDLRLQYRTICVEFLAHEGAVTLPKLFSYDFGDQIGRYVTFIDPNNNQFEVLTETINGCIFLTTGFSAIRDFYDLTWGDGS